MTKLTRTKTAYFKDGKLVLQTPETDDIRLRRFRAKEIVETYASQINGHQILFLNGNLVVELTEKDVACSCKDMEHRKRCCKHIFAGAYLLGDRDAILEQMVLQVSRNRPVTTRQGETRKWRPNTRPQDVRVGKYFMLSDFLYSEKAAEEGIPNCPDLDGKEVQGMRRLCECILDPVVEKFGPLSITYGYVSPELKRRTYGGMSFPLHDGIPGKGQGATLAAAADILVHSKADNPREVLNWIRDNCVYDRLILYPGSSIICTAWTDRPRYECKEWVFPDSFSKALYVNAGREGPPVIKTRLAPEPNGESIHVEKKSTGDQINLFDD